MKPLRRQSLLNHLRGDDYFGTLAAILNLISEFLKEDLTKIQEIHDQNNDRLETLEHLSHDLIWLQQNYTITKRPSGPPQQSRPPHHPTQE